MIGILGDVHGRFSRVADCAEQVKVQGGVALIQLGDFGIHRDMIAKMSRMQFAVPTYVIPGNHEDYRIIEKYSTTELTEIVPNLFFVPRGYVMELDGRKIAFLGGAASVDKQWQIDREAAGGYRTWFPEEVITEDEVARLDHVSRGEIDILVTHTPPQCTIDAHFPAEYLVMYFGLSPTWRDPSAQYVHDVWERLGKPMLYCGHMHRSLSDQGGHVRILDINELVMV